MFNYGELGMVYRTSTAFDSEITLARGVRSNGFEIASCYLDEHGDYAGWTNTTRAYKSDIDPIRFCPLVNPPEQRINTDGVIEYQTDNGNLETAPFKCIDGLYYVTENDEKISIFRVITVKFFEIHMFAMKYYRAKSRCAIIRMDGDFTINGYQTAIVLLPCTSELNEGDIVFAKTAAYENEFRDMIEEYNEDYNDISQSDETHSYVVHIPDIGSYGSVVITNELGRKYVVPDFILAKTRLPMGSLSINLEVDSLIKGTLLTYDNCKYTIVGRHANGTYIVEPYDNFTNFKPTRILCGTPIDDQGRLISEYRIKSCYFGGFVDIPDIDCHKITVKSDVEVKKYNVGDVITLKTKQELIDEYGYNNNDDAPNTMAQYCEVLEHHAGEPLEITRVYDDRYTVTANINLNEVSDGQIYAEDLEDIMISPDMITDSGYEMATYVNNCEIAYSKFTKVRMEQDIQACFDGGVPRRVTVAVLNGINKQLAIKTLLITVARSYMYIVFPGHDDYTTYPADCNMRQFVARLEQSVFLGCEPKIMSLSIDGNIYYEANISNPVDVNTKYIYGKHCEWSKAELTLPQSELPLPQAMIAEARELEWVGDTPLVF